MKLVCVIIVESRTKCGVGFCKNNRASSQTFFLIIYKTKSMSLSSFVFSSKYRATRSREYFIPTRHETIVSRSGQ